MIRDRITPADRPISLDDVQRAVCAHYRIAAREFYSDDRSQRVAHPRQLAMYLARTLTGRSLHQIGRRYRRDHTTVLHGARQAELRLFWDGDLAADVASISRALGC